MKSYYEVKNLFGHDCKGMIEDVDIKSRTVTGYFSRFNNIDSDGDVLVKGAFEKTISERGAKGLIPHILDHDIHITLKQLSKPKLYEKTDGGFFESTISDTTNGIDTLKLYRDGVINQHSFGFKITQKEQKQDARYIKSVLLYEISTVTLGANSETPFTGFKSMTKPELLDRYKLLRKCYEAGDYSDDVFPALEAQIIQIEKELIEQLLNKSETETTQPIVAITEPEVKTRDWNKLFKELKELR